MPIKYRRGRKKNRKQRTENQKESELIIPGVDRYLTCAYFPIYLGINTHHHHHPLSSQPLFHFNKSQLSCYCWLLHPFFALINPLVVHQPLIEVHFPFPIVFTPYIAPRTCLERDHAAASRSNQPWSSQHLALAPPAGLAGAAQVLSLGAFPHNSAFLHFCTLTHHQSPLPDLGIHHSHNCTTA